MRSSSSTFTEKHPRLKILLTTALLKKAKQIVDTSKFSSPAAGFGVRMNFPQHRVNQTSRGLYTAW